MNLPCHIVKHYGSSPVAMQDPPAVRPPAALGEGAVTPAPENRTNI